MATWRDGPEYAPTRRPSGYQPADSPPLEEAPHRERPSSDAPTVRPSFEQRDRVEPLSALHDEPEAGRDPSEAFAVASAAITSLDAGGGDTLFGGRSGGGVWAAVHSDQRQGGPHLDASRHQAWPAPAQAPGTPAQPLDLQHFAPPSGPPIGQDAPPQPEFRPGPAPQAPGWAPPGPAGSQQGAPQQGVPQQGVQPGFPQPGQPQWFGPGQPPPPRAEPAEARVTLSDVVQAATFPTLISLLVGGVSVLIPILGWLAPLAFITAFLTSGRVGYRRDWVRNTFLSASGALAVTLVVGVLASLDDLLLAYDLLCQMSAVVCWVVMIVLLVLMTSALGRGEPPEPPRNNPDPGWG